MSPGDDERERARKVFPQYGEGPLVKVAWAPNQAEAELISGLLLEEGVPSLIKRSAGFDVPDYLAAGPRDILVAASGVDVARDVLAEVPVPGSGTAATGPLTGPSVRGVAIALVAVAAISVVLALAAALLT